jgi:phage/plasmid-like protein (TIGR03299 family)
MHEITTINGTSQFYSLRQPAWHQLGHVSDKPLSFDEAYVASDMDSDYYKSPITTTLLTSDGVTTVEVPDQYAAIRHHKSSGKHTPLGIVGDLYKFHLPREVFGWVDHMVDGGAVIETMGDLNDGRRMFLTIKLPTGVTVGGRDRTDLYVFATTSFDGSSATAARLTGVRVVCANTWRAAESDVKRHKRKRVTVRHSSGLTGNVQKARELLDLGYAMSDELTDLGNQLLSITMRPEDQAQVIRDLFPVSEALLNAAPDKLSRGEKKMVTTARNKRQSVAKLLDSSPTLDDTQRPTAWGLFNAVTEWADHYAPVKGEDASARRAERQILGEAEDIKSQVLSLVLA